MPPAPEGLPADLHDEALSLLLRPEQEQPAAVSALCAQQPAHADAIRAWFDSVLGERAQSAAPKTELASGATVGPYKILEVLGEGGMGTVYLAEQREPVRRRVAFKVIKLGMDSKAVLARFEQERQALAMMEHSNIAKVFDGGQTDSGQPYFAMEYVKGIPITDYCDAQKLTLPERIELFQGVCSGVQHAHLKGVMHRDLKPSNVLVTLQDSRPVTKIIDFGLAKATDHHLVEATLFTEQGQILGTPEYMSPEQAGLGGLDIDTRTDVYSLGVLLYELLVGELPFSRRELREAGFLEMQRVIREQEPEKPSTKITTISEAASEHAAARRLDVGDLRKQLRGDLDWIVLKALEKDRTRRYETALELAADLQRHLAFEPVLASPPSAAYRLRKFVRRYRGQVAVGALVLLLLLGGTTGTTIGFSAASARAAEVQTQKTEIESQHNKIQATAKQLRQRTDEFDLLANVVRLRTAKDRAPELHPPWPGMLSAIDDWLALADGLREALPRIQLTLATMRGRAVPRDPAELEAERAAIPELPKLKAARARLASIRRAVEVRHGRATLAVPPLPAELAEASASALNSFAWERVAQEPGQPRIWGEEPLALQAAQRAAERIEAHGDPSIPLHAVLDTLAWAWIAVGRLDDGVATSGRALAVAPEEERTAYSAHLAAVESAAAAFDVGQAQAIAKLESEVSRLHRAVEAAVTYDFQDESDRFLFDTLLALAAEIEAFLLQTYAEAHSNRDWAAVVDDLTRAHPLARTTWTAAREAVAKADGLVASERYRDWPIADLPPQTGLVPIGMHPVTKLWEFYHLRSAWDPATGSEGARTLPIPTHAAEGRIDVGDGTGIVFVLVPGGGAWLGAQRHDPYGPNFDPDAGATEELEHVVLDPFFLARHELTQAQWKRLADCGTDKTPSQIPAGKRWASRVDITWNHPVEHVDWTTSNTLLEHHGLELPTRAQWESACRAGSWYPWWTGSDPASLIGVENVLDIAGVPVSQTERAQLTEWASHFRHVPVHQHRPNPLGLHQMHGNVAEWTRDAGIGAPAPGDGRRERKPGDSSPRRRTRGGSFAAPPADARSWAETSMEQQFRGPNIGVRPARAVRGLTKARHRRPGAPSPRVRDALLMPRVFFETAVLRANARGTIGPSDFEVVVGRDEASAGQAASYRRALRRCRNTAASIRFTEGGPALPFSTVQAIIRWVEHESPYRLSELRFRVAPSTGAAPAEPPFPPLTNVDRLDFLSRIWRAGVGDDTASMLPRGGDVLLGLRELTIRAGLDQARITALELEMPTTATGRLVVTMLVPEAAEEALSRLRAAAVDRDAASPSLFGAIEVTKEPVRVGEPEAAWSFAVSIGLPIRR